MNPTRQQAAAYVRAHVVDSRTAAEIIGLHSRTAMDYYLKTGAIQPIGMLNRGNLYLRAEVEELKYKLIDEGWADRRMPRP